MTGVVRPREWQAVVGLQWYVLAHLKVVMEYSRREFQRQEHSDA